MSSVSKQIQIPEVSVIVPIYNTGPYLQACLQSIARQTYSNFEVILVDDGSTDNCSEICKKFIETDSRFFYFFKNNEGQATARNLGLKRAKGKFISFIDSDDCVHQDYLSIMVGVIKQEKVDVAVCEFLAWYPPYLMDPIYSKTKRSNISIEDETTFRYGIFSLANHSKTPVIYGGHVANKLFRARVLQGVYFKNWTVEDEMFLFEVARNIRKIAYIREKLYLYRQRPFSSIKASGFNRAILEGREYLLTQCQTSDEEVCVQQAILQQACRIILNSLYLESDSETIPPSDLMFVQQTIRKALAHFNPIEMRPTTRFKLVCFRLVALCPIGFLRVITFLSRKVCFLPFFYKTLKKLVKVFH